jgi:regulatory protein
MDEGPAAASDPGVAVDPREICLAALARREHSRFELQRKLLSRGVKAAEVAAVLDALAAAGWQSDERYVAAFVHSRIARGHGPLKVRAELALRGIRDPGLLSMIERQAGDWSERLADAWRKRFGRPPLDRQELARHARFLHGRGFPPEAIRRFLQSLPPGAADRGDP